ncbi:uncharacterized protein DEA37_0004074, partial [Paragonimus westermani]
MVACTWSYIRKHCQILNYSVSLYGNSNTFPTDKLVQLSSSSKPSITAIWVYLTLHEFHLIPLLCAPLPNGPELTFHHATGLSATLFRWLGGEPCKIPEFATHQVGVAGMLYLSNIVLTVLSLLFSLFSLLSVHKFPHSFSFNGRDAYYLWSNLQER